MPLLSLRCASCGWHQVAGPGEWVAHLRQAGMLKRSDESDPGLLQELMQAGASRLRCTSCDTEGLSVSITEDDWSDTELPASACDICGRAIARERLAALPGVRTCAACQRTDEAGETVEADYCPRCGDVMHLEASQGQGTVRYRMQCRACGYRGT